MTQQTTGAVRAANHPVVETLEARRHLSGDAPFSIENGTLTIRGSAGNEWIVVWQSGPNEVQVEFGRGQDTEFAAGGDSISSIVFHDGGGRDSLTFKNFSTAADIPVTVTGSQGQSVLPAAGGYEVIDGQLSDAAESQVHMRLGRDGILRITGTAAKDEVYVGIEIDRSKLFARVNYTWRTFDLAGIKGVILDGARGDDYVAVDNFHGALHLPVTLMGGLGDDFLVGPNGWGHIMDITVDLENPGYMPTTLLGGQGNDTLVGGLGEDVFNGGEGDDLLHGIREDEFSQGFVLPAGDRVNDAEPDPAPEPDPLPELTPAPEADPDPDAPTGGNTEPADPEVAPAPVNTAEPIDGLIPTAAFPRGVFATARVSEGDEDIAAVWA